jgi:cobalt-zinc-cadmium efflux system protein
MSRTQRLLTVLLLNLGLVAGLVVVGVTAHSLAVLAAGGDYLLDGAGVVVALVAAPRGKRASSIAALINAGWLLVLELLVAVAAADRLIHGSGEVHGLPVLIVSAIAALVMIAGVMVLRGDEGDEGGERDPSVAAVLLDTLADAAAAAGVAVTGAIILVTGSWYWLDPAVALVIAVVIAYHAVALIRKVLARW